jgi:hypothetical protein
VRLAVLISTVAFCITPTALAATSADRASTDAYDRAVHQLAARIASETPEVAAKLDTLARAMGNECHGILAHAPGVEEHDPFGEQPKSALERGEQMRAEQQLSTIRNEITSAMTGPIHTTEAPDVEAFAKTVEPLSWSDPRITTAIHRHAQAGILDARHAAPDTCADIKAWSASGFKKLSPASRARRSEEDPSAIEAETEEAAPTISTRELDKLLRPFESASDRRLLSETKAFYARVDRTFRGLERSFARLYLALGFPQTREERTERKPPIAKGVTEAGERFEVRAVPKEGVHEHGCRAEVSIRLTTVEGHGGQTSGSGSNECISHNRRGQPGSSCGGDVVGIQLAVAPSVRKVRMTLSDGRKITSSVVLISRLYGGPRGLYIQSIRGYEPHPVSLTELGASGRVFRVLKLGRALICHEMAGPEGPFFVALARGTTPDGRPFTIEDDEVRFHGETEFGLEARPGRHIAPGDSEIEVGGTSKTRAFSFSVASECEPHPYTILYGILASPGASVQVRTSAGLVALTKVEIPAKLNSGGTLFYGAFASLPPELVVQRSDGTTLYSESLAARAKEETEFCEGYVEG